MKILMLIIFAIPTLWYVLCGLAAIVMFYVVKPEFRNATEFRGKSWGKNILEMLTAILFYYLLWNFL